MRAEPLEKNLLGPGLCTQNTDAKNKRDSRSIVRFTLPSLFCGELFNSELSSEILH